jgi:GT2 family glycosyltransferase
MRAALSESEDAAVALSAVICTYDRYELLPEAIESLRRQDARAGPIEIIVVDNSPNQEAAAEFGRRYANLPGLTYLTEASPGLSNARNVGTAAARAGIVAFIDDDARATPSWASALIAAHAAYGGRAGIVGGRVVPRWLSEPPAWLGPKLHGYLSLIDLGDERRELTAGEWLLGCNLSFGRDALIAAGGFATNLGRIGPPTNLLSNEEIELCARIRQAGKSAIYSPDAVVEHVIHTERLTQSWFRRRAAWQAVSDLLARPDEASVLAAKAASRLASPLFGRRRFNPQRDRDTAQGVHDDMVMLYSATVLALCGDDAPAARRGSSRLRGALRSLLGR